MGSLSVALLNTAQAQQTFVKALNLVSANVSNVNTPGYATQNPNFITQPFDPSNGLPGGSVDFGNLINTRSSYAEQAVQTRQGYLNQNQQLSTDLTNLNPAFDLSSGSSIPSTLSAFFNSFSTLSGSPNDTTARQQVISAASNVAQAFNSSSSQLGAAISNANSQITQSVGAINSDVNKLLNLNVQRRASGAAENPGIDAQVYSTLEDLSQYVNIQTVPQTDGTVNVYLAGQTPLVVGGHAYTLTAAPGQNSAAILNASGQDITSQVSAGQLGGLLTERNQLLPGYVSGLDQLAQTFADTVNGQLRQGVDSTGAAPTTDLFQYNPLFPASTLEVSGIQAGQIAAADPSSPGGNGNALTLSQLANATAVNGQNFTQAFSTIATKFGQDLSTAQANVTTGQSLLSQAQTNRQNISGVSLDQQAVQLTQFQQAYEAAGDLFQVLNQITQTTIDLLQQ
ncbi:MAG TPA: flagellar hook-associated protein FlgK [Bryobacteraceae bacterium]|jgi:flagellar hook-associated protein 1 FlgK